MSINRYNWIVLIVAAATSIDVERAFSQGRLVLSHTRSRLAAQTTRAILCLGTWSKLGFIKDNDILDVAKLQDVEGEDRLDEGWDEIAID